MFKFRKSSHQRARGFIIAKQDTYIKFVEVIVRNIGRRPEHIEKDRLSSGVRPDLQLLHDQFKSFGITSFNTEPEDKTLAQVLKIN